MNNRVLQEAASVFFLPFPFSLLSGHSHLLVCTFGVFCSLCPEFPSSRSVITGSSPLSDFKLEVSFFQLPKQYPYHCSAPFHSSTYCYWQLIYNWPIWVSICLFSLDYGTDGDKNLSEFVLLGPLCKHSRYSVNKGQSEWMTLIHYRRSFQLAHYSKIVVLSLAKVRMLFKNNHNNKIK